MTSCLGSLPDTIELHISNIPDSSQTVCTGGLRTTFRVGSLFMNDTAPANDYLVLEKKRPSDAPAGAIATVEVWCYGENKQEVGYFKLEKPWHVSVANWAIFVHPSLENRETCLVGTEERGAAPCVFSGLLE